MILERSVLLNARTFTRRDTTDAVYANNKANEYTTVGGTSVTYDAAGNIWRDERDFEYLLRPRQPADQGDQRRCRRAGRGGVVHLPAC